MNHKETVLLLITQSSTNQRKSWQGETPKKRYGDFVAQIKNIILKVPVQGHMLFILIS